MLGRLHLLFVTFTMVLLSLGHIPFIAKEESFLGKQPSLWGARKLAIPRVGAA